jgi:hypothetical protein
MRVWCRTSRVNVPVGVCAPKTQARLFKRIMRTTGTKRRSSKPVDIRGTDKRIEHSDLLSRIAGGRGSR